MYLTDKKLEPLLPLKINMFRMLNKIESFEVGSIEFKGCINIGIGPGKKLF